MYSGNGQKHPIEGLDTETIQGKAILICNSENYLEPKSFEQIIDFMCQCKTNFFYNIDYDVTAIFKWLPKKIFEKIYFTKNVELKDYQLFYVKNKFLRITKNNQNYYFYDLYQYFNMSLNRASEKYLNQKKIEIDKKIIENLDKYYKKYREKIIKYCIQDANLTKMLAEKLIEWFNQANIYPDRFYSIASIAGKIIKQNIEIPELDQIYYDFIHQSYYGGRLEITYRGKLKNVYIYDIRSAYPSIIRKLPNLAGAVYEWNKKPKTKYYFVDCNIKFKDAFIYPLCKKIDGITVYPKINERRVITCFEYELLQSIDILEKFKINKVLNIYTDDTKPFKFVENLYQKRKINEACNYIYKIILNSLYGKFYEKQIDYFELNEYYQTGLDNYYQKQYLYMRYVEFFKKYCKNLMTYKCNCIYCKQFRYLTRKFKGRMPIKNVEMIYDEGKLSYLKAYQRYGQYHNIIYASLITSGIRTKIYEVAYQLGNAFIASHTDSIFSFAPIPGKYIGENMGDFELKTRTDEMILIGCGMYQYDDVIKFRGYSTDKSYIDLLKNEKRTKLEIESLFRVTAGAYIQQTKKWKFSDINRLIVMPRKLDVNFDIKRNWEKQFKYGKDVLKELHKSKPLEV